MEFAKLIESMLTNFPNFAGLALLSYVLYAAWKEQSDIIAARIAKMDENAKEDAETIRWLMERHFGNSNTSPD